MKKTEPADDNIDYTYSSLDRMRSTYVLQTTPRIKTTKADICRKIYGKPDYTENGDKRRSNIGTDHVNALEKLICVVFRVKETEFGFRYDPPDASIYIDRGGWLQAPGKVLKKLCKLKTAQWDLFIRHLTQDGVVKRVEWYDPNADQKRVKYQLNPYKIHEYLKEVSDRKNVDPYPNKKEVKKDRFEGHHAAPKSEKSNYTDNKTIFSNGISSSSPSAADPVDVASGTNEEGFPPGTSTSFCGADGQQSETLDPGQPVETEPTIDPVTPPPADGPTQSSSLVLLKNLTEDEYATVEAAFSYFPPQARTKSIAKRLLNFVRHPFPEKRMTIDKLHEFFDFIDSHGVGDEDRPNDRFSFSPEYFSRCWDWLWFNYKRCLAETSAGLVEASETLNRQSEQTGLLDAFQKMVASYLHPSPATAQSDLLVPLHGDEDTDRSFVLGRFIYAYRTGLSVDFLFPAFQSLLRRFCQKSLEIYNAVKRAGMPIDSWCGFNLKECREMAEQVHLYRVSLLQAGFKAFHYGLRANPVPDWF